MRSRYAAFALGLGEYLVDTLASTHPDLEQSRASLEAGLTSTRDTQRFAGLRILHTSQQGERGEVLFFARLYQRGADASFAELSQFVRENGAWRYAEGQLVEAARLPRDLTTLTREAFLALAKEQ